MGIAAWPDASTEKLHCSNLMWFGDHSHKRDQNMHVLVRITLGGIAGLICCMVMTVAAYADQIDGEWCREGRHFKIEGPNIVTYGGTSMTGDYNRHGFRYVVPARESEAGTEIVMTLHGDDLLDLVRTVKGAKDGSPSESWRRCRVTS